MRSTWRTLDLAVVGEQGGRTRHCRSCQRQHDRARAQKNTLQPHRRQHWVIPPKANSAFVAAMEDVLAVYTRPREGDCPLVCLDETSKQLIAETRVPIPMKAGRPARFAPPRVVNLMDALRASVDAEEKKAPAPSTRARRPAKKKASR